MAKAFAFEPVKEHVVVSLGSSIDEDENVVLEANDAPEVNDVLEVIDDVLEATDVLAVSDVLEVIDDVLEAIDVPAATDFLVVSDVLEANDVLVVNGMNDGVAEDDDQD